LNVEGSSPFTCSNPLKAIKEKKETFGGLKPTDVQDDKKYKKFIITPLWIVVRAQSAGVIGAIQKFVDVESKFSECLYNVRDDFIRVDGDIVSLDPDFQHKLEEALSKAFKSQESHYREHQQ